MGEHEGRVEDGGMGRLSVMATKRGRTSSPIATPHYNDHAYLHASYPHTPLTPYAVRC